MYFEIHKIIEKIQGNEIVIYGAGAYAKKMYSILGIYGMQKKVRFFVVSEISSIEKIDEISVISVRHLNEIQEKLLIIVAVNRQYVGEIQDTLRKYGFFNILFMADYERTDEYFLPWIYEKDKKELFNYVINGLISNQKISTKCELEKISEKLQFCNRNLKYTNKRKVLFFLCLVTARTARIISALKSVGYKVIVYLFGSLEYIGEKEIQEIGVEVKRYFTPQEILYEMLQMGPAIYYLDPSKREYQLCGIITAFKKYFGKVILAPYDIFSGSTLGLNEKIYKMEKYCFENADGIIWRYFSKDFLHNNLGFAYNGNSIFLPDCCENYSIEMHSKSDILKICCMPTHAHEALAMEPDMSKYTHEATLWEILSRIGNSMDCIFHVFFWNISDKEKELLEKLKEKYNNFNYFIHIDHRELIEHILPRYDYGCSINTCGWIPKYPEGITIGMGKKRSENALRYGSSNKFYDFISAGLSVIATIPSELCQYLSKYGVIIDMDLEHFDVQYLREHREQYQKNALYAKSKLQIRNYVSLLNEFISGL